MKATRMLGQTIQGTQNSGCYAGLMHTEMRFIDENIRIPQTFTSSEGWTLPEEEIVTKKFIVIIRKCDTCNYTEEIKKEYLEPEQLDKDMIIPLPGSPENILTTSDVDKENRTVSELSHPIIATSGKDLHAAVAQTLGITKEQAKISTFGARFGTGKEKMQQFINKDKER
jgi:hypothetical protein